MRSEDDDNTISIRPDVSRSILVNRGLSVSGVNSFAARVVQELGLGLEAVGAPL